MSVKKEFSITGTSPAAAGTAAGAILRGLAAFDWFTVDAALVGATGGTLDVYLQRAFGEAGSETWVDWLHFPQLAAGTPAVNYTVPINAGVTAITVVGRGTTPALAANTFIGGHPGDIIRALYVAGASTSAGAAVAINLQCWNRIK